MKILVLESSGNAEGSSNMLAGEFIRGAREAGNETETFDVLKADIRPCLGCGRCAMDGPCVQQDDYELKLKPMILDADMLVFVMPVYYCSWPAQMKAVVDRFYSYAGELTSMRKKTALLCAAWDEEDSSFELVKACYEKICGCMQFEDQGMVIGRGCGTPSMTRSSGYPQEARELGRSIR